MDNEAPELTASDLERLAAKVVALESQLAKLQTLASRIESNSYGKCEACSTEIEMEILAADPEALFCGQHSSQGQNLI
ncbi:MAG: hypothetical protein EPN30_06850 [Actinomycetota bacterium]|nr:MAG: hypothetical protein EPN30_06850 [Actinomycetota bacterium]